MDGLNEKIRVAARNWLLAAFPIWQEIIPSELRRVVRRDGSLTLEPYRGSQAFLEFEKRTSSDIARMAFDRAVQEVQPALVGSIALPNMTMPIGGPSRLVGFWLQELERRSGVEDRLEQTIDAILGDVDELLRTKSASYQVLSPLRGLQLPDSFERLQIAEGVEIRRIKDDEFTRLCSGDALIPSQTVDIWHQLDTAITVTQTIPFQIVSPGEQANPTIHIWKDAKDRTDLVVLALHLIKKGSVSAPNHYPTVWPMVFPSMEGVCFFTLGSSQPFCNLSLSEEELATLPELVRRLQAVQCREVHLAATRLKEAEHRLSVTDAIIDAFVGLETILNPSNTEVTFRTSLNYAFLAPDGRRKRYDLIYRLYKTRSAAVHGNLNRAPAESKKVHADAEEAKSCLRDVIRRFLEDPSLQGNGKLDSGFWLDRIFEDSP